MRFLIHAGDTAIAVEDGIVVPPSGRFDWAIEIPDGEVRPGLINAHDHLHRNHYGRLGRGPYANAYEWAADIQVSHRKVIARGRRMQRRRALLFGAWKNLLSGVTAVVHHDAWESDFERGFPIRVIRVASADSLGMTPGFRAPTDAPFALHVAEGIDRGAAEEVQSLQMRGLLNRRLIAVHAVGPDAAGVAALRKSGCAIVWCPSSNKFLFGRTAPDELLAEGVDVLLGTDSLLTGAETLFDELRGARGRLSDDRLKDAVGPTAARRLGIAPPHLTFGEKADLILLRRPLLEAAQRDIVVVMVGGEFRVVDHDIAASLRLAGGQAVESNGNRRWISEQARL